LEVRDRVANVLHDRVNIEASDPALSDFVIPGVRNVPAGTDVGFALVNVGPTPASITGTVRDADGMIIAVRSYLMPAGAQTAAFAQEFFSDQGCLPCLSSNSADRNYASITFNSASPQFAAIALMIESGSLASSPVQILEK
jgi:hypothetical protein